MVAIGGRRLIAAAALSLASFGCENRQSLAPNPGDAGADGGIPSSLDAAPPDAVAAPDASAPCSVTAGGTVAPCTTMLVGSQLDNSYCALKPDGQLRCWSYDAYFDDLFAKIVARAPPGLVRIAISETNGDDPFLCGIDGQGNGTCWGRSTMTSLGGGVVSAVLSRYGTCAVYEDGHVDCASIFPRLPADRRYVQVALGADFIFGLDDAGAPVHVQSFIPTPPGVFRRIAKFSSLDAALRDDGAMVLVNGREPFEAPGPFVDLLFAYRENLCGLDAAGEVTCFPLVAGQASPPAAPAGPFVHVVGSGRSLCGLRPTGTTTCWGEAGVRVPEGW